MQANENRIQSLEAENRRLGSQNARLERDRLTGDRLNQGSAAELGALGAKIRSEIERLGKLEQEAEAARVERVEEEKKMEEACMACGDKKRSVKLPCGGWWGEGEGSHTAASLSVFGWMCGCVDVCVRAHLLLSELLRACTGRRAGRGH